MPAVSHRWDACDRNACSRRRLLLSANGQTVRDTTTDSSLSSTCQCSDSTKPILYTDCSRHFDATRGSVVDPAIRTVPVSRRWVQAPAERLENHVAASRLRRPEALRPAGGSNRPRLRVGASHRWTRDRGVRITHQGQPGRREHRAPFVPHVSSIPGHQWLARVAPGISV